MIRYHYGKDPDSLDTDQWAALVKEYGWIKKRDREMFREDLQHVLYELANRLYGGKKT